MLDPTSLKQAAIDAAGLADFGSAPMDEGLERFTWSLTNEAQVAGKQLEIVSASIVATLVQRLKIEHFLAAHPEVLAETVDRPLFVMSLPRTGSTATSQFLSEDPNARSLRRWEHLDVVPPPDAAIGDADPRVAKMQAQFEELYRQQPARRGMLPVDAKDPSEHGPLLGLTFQNLQMPSLYKIPAYADWVIASDLRPAYAYFKKVLQLLQWKTPASHWNLKNPPDIFGFGALVEVFPDARLAWVHRDPVKSIPSVCSLTSMIRDGWGEALDRPGVGAFQLGFQSRGAQIAMTAEKGLPAGRVVHAFQRDLIKDTVGTIADMYARLDLAFTDSYREHLTRRVANRDKPSHAYDMGDYGLSVPQIRAAFSDYTDHYGVPLEA